MPRASSDDDSRDARRLGLRDLILPAIIVALIAVGIVAGTQGWFADQGDTLENASYERGFEDRVAAWSIFNRQGENVARSGEIARSDTFSLKVYGATEGPTYPGASQDVPAHEGDSFVARVWLLTRAFDRLSGGHEALIKIEFVGTDMAVESQKFGAKDLPDQWHLRQVSATAPAGTRAARVAVVLIDPPGGGGAVYFDDADLERTAEGIRP